MKLLKSLIITILIIAGFYGSTHTTRQQFVQAATNLINIYRDNIMNMTAQQIANQMKQREPEHYVLFTSNILTLRRLLVYLNNLLPAIDTPLGYTVNNATQAECTLTELQKQFKSMYSSRERESGQEGRAYGSINKALQILKNDFPQLF